MGNQEELGGMSDEKLPGEESASGEGLPVEVNAGETLGFEAGEEVGGEEVVEEGELVEGECVEMEEVGEDEDVVVSGGGGGGGMRTIQKQFCEEFGEAVGPVMGPLVEVADALEGAPRSMMVRDVLPRLHDLNHQMQVLIDKVAQQHAYVLIFGPLKSGKSTFMNAMCSSYVSEVTCLPAYPAMVFVSNDDEPASVVTHYNGSTSTYADEASLHRAVQVAHIQLTETIRRVEAEGEKFDPAIHMPGAIRKIDVKLPTGDLAESGAMLVDTPGLYSRMRFGYDQMTRDFRDAAACAIFIVKTDNLFLEQVFEEFEELLGLFSRIFLIVNLDTNKKDLAADGSLELSLESADPGKIIEAFEDLSMSASLKAAAEEGRLVIHPVDLLSAASQRMVRKASEGAEGEGSVVEVEGEAEDFETLQTELTDYLNSNDYLKAFLVDSLRRAHGLLGEVSALMEDPAVKSLEDEVHDLRARHEAARLKGEAIQRVKSVDLGKFAKPLGEALERRGIDFAKAVKVEMGHTLSGAIDGWFNHDQSLAGLNGHTIRPTLEKAKNQYHGFLRDELGRQTDNAKGGLTVYETAVEDFGSVGIEFEMMAREAYGLVCVEDECEAFEGALLSDGIPVVKGFWDWILFRSKQSVRRRVLGAPENPESVIQPPVKAKRLGDGAKRAMQSMATELLERVLGETALKIPGQVTDQYVSKLGGLLGGRLDAIDKENQAELEELGSKLTVHEDVLNHITAMALEVEQTSKDVNDLNDEYGEPFEGRVEGLGGEDVVEVLGEAVVEVLEDDGDAIELSEEKDERSEGSFPDDGDEDGEDSDPPLPRPPVGW